MRPYAQASVHAGEPAYAQASPYEVTAAEYCAFLNQNAAADPEHLFDGKMEVAPEAVCIVRFGTPGKYFIKSYSIF